MVTYLCSDFINTAENLKFLLLTDKTNMYFSTRCSTRNKGRKFFEQMFRFLKMKKMGSYKRGTKENLVGKMDISIS